MGAYFIFCIVLEYFIGRFPQLMYLILEEEPIGIIKKYEIENYKKVNRIFYIYTISKNFKHICITKLNLIESTLGFGSANASMPLTNRHRSTDTVACRAQLCYCHSFSIAPRNGKVSRSQQKGY